MFGLLESRRALLALIVARLVCSASSMLTRGPTTGQDGRAILYTQAPVKRDATICPTGQSLCAASMNGGCCPTDRSCGTDSCYAVAPQTGIVYCGVDQGGGSCPSGYACAGNGCSALPGVTSAQTCRTSYYLCPTSVAYGCCPNGFACGVGICSQTSFATVSLTRTIVSADANSQTTTITTVITTAYVPPIVSVAPATAVASTTTSRFSAIPTAISKVSPTSDASTGLSTVALGCIIGAAVAVLLGIAIATYCIIRRVNAVARASGSGSGSKGKPKRPSDGKPRRSNTVDPNFDTLSIDPLMMSSSSAVGTPRLFQAAVPNNSRSGSAMASPPIPAPYYGPHGYGEAANSDQRSDSYHSRQHSNQSSPPVNSSPRNADGYFAPDPDLRDQNLRHGHTSSQLSIMGHGRQWSDTSEVSHQSDSSGYVVELDASADTERRTTLDRMGLRGHGHRRSSSEIKILVQGRRPDLETTPADAGVEMPANSRVRRKRKGVRDKGLSQSTIGREGESSTNARQTISESVREDQAETNQGPNTVVAGTVPQTAGEATKKMTADALDLELQLERLEGQKIRGSGMDFLRDRI